MEEQVLQMPKEKKSISKKTKIIAGISAGVAVLAAAGAVVFKIVKSKSAAE